MPLSSRSSILLTVVFAALLAPSVSEAGSTAPFPATTPGWAVVTNSSARTSSFSAAGPVAKVWDLATPGGVATPRVWKQSDTPPPTEFTPTDPNGHPIWSGTNLGQVFGIAIDDDPRGPFIYLTATAIYGSTITPVTSPTIGGCSPEQDCYPGNASLSDPLAANQSPFASSPAPGLFASDSAGNPIYGAVWRLSLGGGLGSGLGTYELIATIRSNRMSLGQIAYNTLNRRFYVSNFDDGRIYTFVNPAVGSGIVSSFPATDVYDHGLQGRPNVAGQGGPIFDDPNMLFTAYGRRVWGLQYNAVENRLYYAVWNRDFRNQSGSANQIWSVALDAVGRPNPSAANAVRMEFAIPPYPGGIPSAPDFFSSRTDFTQPVSDIAFNQAGDIMVLAERGERIGRNFFGGYEKAASGNSTLPHNSRILRYRKSLAGQWTRDTGSDLGEYAGDLSNNTISSGVIGNHTNSAGGVDFGYAYAKRPPDQLNPTAADGWIWSTVNSYETLSAGRVYGSQGARIPVPDANGATPLQNGQDVLFVDYDDDYVSSPKSMVGDIEIHRIAAAPNGILKICKVAGPGVTVGTQFTFGASGSAGAIAVPAGPPPGGYCVVGPSYPAGTQVAVTETGPTGYAVTNIGVRPPSRQIGTSDLAHGTVQVTVGPGVTEVTYTDEKRTGYIEICKNGRVAGDFMFNIPGVGQVTVPAGACSPAIEVNAGTLTITELPRPGTVLVACSAIPLSNLANCNTSARTATITVSPGDISGQTIVTFTNNRSATEPHDSTDDAPK